MTDLRTDAIVKGAFRSRTLASATTTTGTAVDTTGYTDCLVIMDVGTITGSGTTADATITEATTGGGSYSAITGAAFAQVATTGGGATVYVGHIKLGRSGGPWIKASILTAGAAVSVPVSMVYVLYNKGDSANWSANTQSFQVG